MPRHRHQDFIWFRRKIDIDTLVGIDVHLTVENYHTMGLHAHPSILGPGVREPNPLAWFRPTRASIHFEERGLPCERSESVAPRAAASCHTIPTHRRSDRALLSQRLRWPVVLARRRSARFHPLSRLLLRTTFQEVVHGHRIEPQLGFHRFVLG